MKKIVSLCLAFCMMFSMMCSAAVAENAGNSAEMEKVLVQVRSKIEIDQKYSEFSYRYNSYDENSYWIFTWGWPDNGDIQIQADDKGRIKSYNKWTYTNGKESHAPSFTRPEAQSRAAAFMKKAIPEVYGALSASPEYTANSQSQCYYFTYKRYENGIPCINQQVSIRVNYVTGEVENMSVEWLYDVEFKKVESPITQEDAKTKWKGKTELELKYLYNFGGIDSVGKTVKAFLAYVPTDETKSVNAETGEILDKEYEWVYDSDAGDATTEDMVAGESGSGSNSAANKVQLSEEELKKIAEHDNLLTLNQADKKVREFPELSLNANFRISSSNLIADSYAYPVAYGEQEGVGYSWRIVYSGPVTKGQSPQSIYVTVDAVTGELESYRDYEADDLSADVKATMTLDKARAIADKFIKKVSEDKAGKVLEPEDTERRSWNSNGKEVQTGWQFKYTRANEGIPTASDSINVTVNRMTGKVTGYTRTWQERVEFEETTGIISADDAVAAYIDNARANLEYHIFTTYLYDLENANEEEKEKIGYAAGGVKNRKSTVLVYSFESPSTVISAKSGKYIDYNGAEVKDTGGSNEFKGYSDTKGHYAEREISLLADIGVLPQKEKFAPYQAVKQKEFLYYLFMGANSYRMYTAAGADDTAIIDEVYQTALNASVITQNEINREAQVSRYQAIRFLVRYMGLGKLASDPTIFRVEFKDAANIPKEYLGSVAIGKSMLIIGGSNGSFNGSLNLTNGDAAKIIYNTLKKAGEY